MPSQIIPFDRLSEIGTAGLSEVVVAQRRARFGSNDIIETVTSGRFAALLETARDPMLWFLLVTSALFAFIGDFGEAAVLLVATVPLAGMDLYLNRRTRASTEGLASRLAATARVVRDGMERIVPAREVLPGDRVVVDTGEIFPADGLVCEGDRLQVDESALSGEAFPVTRRAFGVTLPVGPMTVECEHCVYAGTRLLSGRAEVVITAIGGETRYGAIVRSVRAGKHARTPLQLAVGNLVAVLLVVATVLCVMLAWVRWTQGHGLVDALISAITLAVAALPEEFPVVLAFYLGVGVYRLAARQALVRRAVVVENIGRVSAICSDKTGTITLGQLTLAHVLPAPGVAHNELLRIAGAASRQETGDPLDSAILAALPVRIPWVAETCFPFTEDRRRETGIWRDDGIVIAAQKGAPEAVLSACVLSADDRAHWLAQVAVLAAGAHKVIACAVRSFDASTWSGGEPDRGYRFAGLLALEDPIRPGVVEAMQACAAAGLRVMMLTGDHPDTARAVAIEIGLGGTAPMVIDGDALEAAIARDAITSIDVVARAQPAQKLDAVRALQAAGHIVAVTGDGVNDVPALQAADVGIAMGGRGTQSAREAAAIVLLDDAFASIVHAIAEGRQLFDNLKKSFAFLLTIHVPLVFTATFIPLAGYPLLYLPVHIVWFELMIHPISMFVFQRHAPATLDGTAPGRSARFFGLAQWLSILVVGTVIAVLLSWAYLATLADSGEITRARATAMAGLSVASVALMVGLAGLASRPSRVAAALALGAAALLIETPYLNTALGLSPLPLGHWLAVSAGGVAIVALSALASTFSSSRGPLHLLWGPRFRAPVRNPGSTPLKP